jgi:hypothetical protein
VLYFSRWAKLAARSGATGSDTNAVDTIRGVASALIDGVKQELADDYDNNNEYGNDKNGLDDITGLFVTNRVKVVLKLIKGIFHCFPRV